MSSPTVSVIMPALNEAANLEAAVGCTLREFDRRGIDGELVVVDDGSSDGTAALAEELARRDRRIGLLRHATPRGIGAAFWHGVAAARGEAVCMMPGDNESDPGEILRYLPLLDHVDFVVPFIFNKEVRSPLRNLISWLYRTIVNTTFLVNFNYTNGTVLYRRKVLQRIEHHDTGFFYNTDVLMRLARLGYLYAEVPCRLKTRAHGPSKAISLRALARVVRGYLRLVRGLYMRGAGPQPRDFCENSRTFQRRAEAATLTAGELLELAPPAERHAYARLDS